MVKNLSTMQGMRVRSLVREVPHASEQLSPCTPTTEVCAQEQELLKPVYAGA